MTEDASAPVAKPKPRRKSFAHTEKEVVTTGEFARVGLHR